MAQCVSILFCFAILSNLSYHLLLTLNLINSVKMLNLKTIVRDHNIVPQLIRWLSVAAKPQPCGQRVQAWQVHSYGEEVQLSDIRNPMITSPTEVQVKIDAASVNPLDVMMKGFI